MPYSYAIYTGNGSQTQFALTFPYIRKEHIKVYVNYVDTAYTYVNDTTVQLASAPANGARVEVRRITPLTAPLVDYTDGSTLVAADLDTSNLQHLYKEQELDDDNKQAVFIDPATGLPTANGQRITNVANPTSAQDAATKAYVDTTTVASAGDTMTGNLAMSGNKVTGLGTPTDAQDATTKTYVDSTTVASAGDTMSGNLAMAGNKVTGLGTPVDAQDAANKTYVDSNYWDNTTDTIDSTETWVSDNTKIATTAAHDSRHTMVVALNTPSAPPGGWQVGKQWLQNDNNKTLSYWNGSSWTGITSGGTFSIQATVIYVDGANGDDANDGHRIITPKKTIKSAVASANAGDIIKVAPGVYQETLPIDVTVANLSIVGDSLRSCFIHPTAATETSTIFRCNSGTYIANFTFAGLKASGARGGHPIDNSATYGLPTSQGWVAGFYPGATIVKSPYIQNCTNIADSAINNSSFNPNNLPGTAGDLTSAPTGGGIIVDGSLPDVASPLRSFLVDSFTQICLDGPGTLVCNNGYAQLTSSYGFFNHYHVKALKGGQANLSASTTDFGRYGLIADGKSNTAIFSALASANASINAITFTIDAPTAAGTWFGDATRPAENMLVQVNGNTYPILSATAAGAGWTVTISRPDPANQSVNLGLVAAITAGDTVDFFLRSMISTSGHTMEYVGAGTNYSALPENGGVPVEANQTVDLNDGKVWISSTDHNGKFKVGSTLTVDQRTGFVTIPSGSIAFDLASDLTPQLGGDLDVLNRQISSSTGNVVINDTLSLNSNKIINVTNPTAAQDAATKDYVDTAISGINTSQISQGDTSVSVSDTGTGSADIVVDGSTAGTFGASGINLYKSLFQQATLHLTDQNKISFWEATANGLNSVGFKGPANIAADVTWTLPAADGSANQALTTNGSATLSWVSYLLSTGGTVTGNVTLDNQADLRFGEATGHGGNWVAFQAPSTIAANVTWTLPATDATVAGHALKSDAAGNLSWGTAGGATGGGTDDVFYENSQTVTTSYTLTSNKNAMSAGPITISNGATVTIPSGATWVIV